MIRAALCALATALFAVSACSEELTPAPDTKPASDLETAAIAAGVIPDPQSADLTGLYARDTDRVCIVPGRQDFRIGAYLDYGDRQGCSGTGSAKRAGESLRISFDAAPGCEFDARFEGDRIVFPGQLPPGCARLCEGRASLAAVDVERLSDSPAEAGTLRDPRGRLLCGPDQ